MLLRIHVVVGVVTAAALAGASPAGAAVTFGSDLSREANGGFSCYAGGTFAQTAFPPRNVRAPMDGVVVRWRIRASSGPPTPLRIIHMDGDNPYSGGAYAGRATSRAEDLGVPPGWSYFGRGPLTFATRLPIRRGDVLGIDVPPGEPGDESIVVMAFATLKEPFPWSGFPGAMLRSWDPRLQDGEKRYPGYPNDCWDRSDYELLVNVDIEPDADGDVYGDESQDQCLGDRAHHTSPCTGPPQSSTAPVPTSTPRPVEARRSPILRIRSARVRRGRLYIRGSLRRRARRKLQVAVRATRSTRGGRQSFGFDRWLRPRRGLFRASLKLPPQLRAARRLTIRVQYMGDRIFRPEARQVTRRARGSAG